MRRVNFAATAIFRLLLNGVRPEGDTGNVPWTGNSRLFLAGRLNYPQIGHVYNAVRGKASLKEEPMHRLGGIGAGRAVIIGQDAGQWDAQRSPLPGWRQRNGMKIIGTNFGWILQPES